jgi:CRP-like cAMP-binding protein
MDKSSLGKVYDNGQVIVQQGDKGDHMYVIQKGKVEVIQEKDGNQIKLAVLVDGDIFGEMSLFDRVPRSSTVRALGEVRVLTIDKKTFLRRVHEDPSLAFRILQKMSQRIRDLNEELIKTKKPHTEK